MIKSFIKIIFLLSIFGFSWTGLLVVGQTFALFDDIERSKNNSFQAGTLDLSLRASGENFTPSIKVENMTPGDSVARDIYIKKDGSLPFKYQAHSEYISGFCDIDLYNALELRVWYNYFIAEQEHLNCLKHRRMVLKYDGLLRDFDLRALNPDDPDLRIPNDNPYFNNRFYKENEHWFFFLITLPKGVSDDLRGKSCQFKFVFEGWQENIANYMDGGFTDTEEIENTIKASYWNPHYDSNIIESENTDEKSDDNSLTNEEIVADGYSETDVNTIPINATTTAFYSSSLTVPLTNGTTTVADESEGTEETEEISNEKNEENFINEEVGGDEAEEGEDINIEEIETEEGEPAEQTTNEVDEQEQSSEETGDNSNTDDVGKVSGATDYTDIAVDDGNDVNTGDIGVQNQKDTPGGQDNIDDDIGDAPNQNVDSNTQDGTSFFEDNRTDLDENTNEDKIFNLQPISDALIVNATSTDANIDIDPEKNLNE